MMTFRRTARVMVVAAATMLVALYLALPPLSRTAAFRTWVQRTLASTAGYDVQLATVAIEYDLSIAAGEVSVAAAQQQPFLRARTVAFALSPWMLFTGRVASLRIDEPHLFVDHLPASPADSAPTALPVTNLQIVNGFVHTATQGDVVLGPLSLRIELPFEVGDTREGEDLHATAKIVLANVEFHDAEHARAGDKIRGDGHVEVSWRSGTPTLHLDLRLVEGEILWQRFYADLKQHHTTLSGELSGTRKGMLLRDAMLNVDGIGSINVSGSMHPGSGRSDLRARIDMGGLNQLYALAVRDALRETYPLLARTDAGGKLSADLEYQSGKRDWSLSGNIRLEDAYAVATDPSFELRGLGVDLPVALGTRTLSTTARTGSLRFSAFHLGDMQIPETSAALSVIPNAVRLATPLSMPLLGGSFVLNEIEASSLDSPHPQATLNFALHELDLEQLSRALGWPLLRGSMEGEASRVRIANGELLSDGEIRAQVFGGQVQVRNLRVRQIASSVPALELDVDFQDILLARLTETLEVGSISGVAHGAVHDLAIVHGEPLRFDAWVETVPRSDVAQRISVKAIRQISTLGGAGGDPLSQGLLSFFDEYRYAKMGLRCRLENDRFLLQGIEQFDGKDYLVVGSFLPPRVNVISHTQVISFSEMVDRLGRVTSEHAGETKRSE